MHINTTEISNFFSKLTLKKVSLYGLLFFLGCYSLITEASSATIISLQQENNQRENLANASYVLETNENKFENILKHDKLFLFTPLRKTHFGIKKDHQSLWIKFTLKNETTAHLTRIVEINPSQVPHLALYSIEKELMQKVESEEHALIVNEILKARHKESVPHFSSKAIQIELLPLEERVYFLHIDPIPKASYFLTLETNHTYFKKLNLSQITLGIMFGFLTALSFYHAYLYINTGKKDYLLYTITFLLSIFGNAFQSGLFQSVFSIFSAETEIKISLAFVHLTVIIAMFLCLTFFYRLQNIYKIGPGFIICVCVHIINLLLTPFISLSLSTEITSAATFFSIIWSIHLYFIYPIILKKPGLFFILAKVSLFIPVFVIWNMIYGDYELYFSIAHFSSFASCLDAFFLALSFYLIRENENEKSVFKKQRKSFSSINNKEKLAKLESIAVYPINSQLSIINLFQQTELSQLQKEYLFLLNQSTHELDNNIKIFLSDLQEKKQNSEKKSSFNLKELIEHNLRQYKKSESKTTYNLIWHDYVLSVRSGEKARIEQILLNMLCIAEEKEYIDTINLEVEEKQNDRNNLFFTLTSFNKKHTENITKPSNQGETQHKNMRSYVIFSAEKIINLLGGTLNIQDSEEKRTIIFSLPLSTVDLPQEIMMSDEAFSQKKILILEKNLTELEIYKYLTQKWGMECITSTDTSETMALLRAHHNLETPFHFILINATNQHEKSIEMVKKIRQSGYPYSETIKVIFSIDDMHNSLFIELKNRRIIDYLLIKPISSQALKAALKSLL